MSASDGEQDAETDVDEPKRKRPKVLQKYLPGYQVKYPVIRHSSVSENLKFGNIMLLHVLTWLANSHMMIHF